MSTSTVTIIVAHLVILLCTLAYLTYSCINETQEPNVAAREKQRNRAIAANAWREQCALARRATARKTAMSLSSDDEDATGEIWQDESGFTGRKRRWAE